MNNNSSYFDSLMSSLPKMSSVTVDSMLTPQLINALLSISQSYSSVALNASVLSITVAYRSVLSSLGIASATLLSECSQVLSTHSPVIEAAKLQIVLFPIYLYPSNLYLLSKQLQLQLNLH